MSKHQQITSQSATLLLRRELWQCPTMETWSWMMQRFWWDFDQWSMGFTGIHMDLLWFTGILWRFNLLSQCLFFTLCLLGSARTSPWVSKNKPAEEASGSEWNVTGRHHLSLHLVGGLELFYFSIYLECHHPNWRTHIVSEGLKPNHQPVFDR